MADNFPDALTFFCSVAACASESEFSCYYIDTEILCLLLLME